VTDTLNPKTKEDYRDALSEMRWRFVQAVIGLQDIQAMTNKSDATMREVYDEAERILHALRSETRTKL
jgi:hypothetical protein